MTKYILKITLESDAAFGRGDGVAGAIDTEVQHDQNGFPFLNGRTIKGLLVQECADILAALSKNSMWEQCARRLFGAPGSSPGDSALMMVGNALLSEDLRLAIKSDIKEKRIRPEEVLDLFTSTRSQTAIDESGVARDSSLRRIRVILRKTPFESELFFVEQPPTSDLALLAACIKAFRRGGTGITRGLGRLSAELLDQEQQPVTDCYFNEFRKAVQL